MTPHQLDVAELIVAGVAFLGAAVCGIAAEWRR
jgi:hypothetical protein